MTKWNLFFLLLIVLSFKSYGQIKITGQVVDAQNKPIALATINLAGKNIDATTDDSGVFFLTLPDNIKSGDPITLRVSKSGYKITTKNTPVSYLSISIKLNRDLSPNNKTSTALSQSNGLSKPITTTQIDNQPSNVTSYFQSGGITAQTVNINQEKQLNEADKKYLMQFIENIKAKFNFNPTCFTISMVNNSNGNKIAAQIESTLKANGYTMKGNTYGYEMRSPPVKGVEINKSSEGDCLEILVGEIQ